MQINNHVFTSARKKPGFSRPEPEPAPVPRESVSLGNVMLKCGSVGAATLGGLAAVAAYSPTNGPGLAGMAVGVGTLAMGWWDAQGLEGAGVAIGAPVAGVLTYLAAQAGPFVGAQLGLGPLGGAVAMGVVGGTLGSAGVYLLARATEG